jgi:glycerol-3-phosphate dehydrogenase
VQSSGQGIQESGKLICDDGFEFDAESGMISILGGDWTTHRPMGQEAIDRVQEYLREPPIPAQMQKHLLSGSGDYRWDYWETLQRRSAWLISTKRQSRPS